MSDTPISDSIAHDVGELGMLCRKLERQLTAANVEIEEKRKDIVYIATEKAKLENRIERLEEAGDAAIHEAGHGREHDALEIWNKAKEAKL